MDTTETRQCSKCHKPNKSYRSAKAWRCTTCDTAAAADRRVYEAMYHRARSKAAARLIEKHREEFDDLKEEELSRQRMASNASSAGKGRAQPDPVVPPDPLSVVLAEVRALRAEVDRLRTA